MTDRGIEVKTGALMDCGECGEEFDSPKCCVNDKAGDSVRPYADRSDPTYWMLARRDEIEKILTLLDLAESHLSLKPLPTPPFHTAPLLTERLGRALSIYAVRLDESDRELRAHHAEITKTVRDLQGDARYYHSGTPAEQVRHLVDYYREVATSTIEGAKQFRDDVVVQLRSFSLVVDMAAAGGTHREKDARLRGLTELIEGGISKLRDMRFDLVQGRWWPDVFRSDHTTRDLVRAIHQKDDAIKRLQRELRAAKGEPEPEGEGEPLEPLPF